MVTLARAGASRWSAIGVTVLLHLLLAAAFLLQRADRVPEPQTRWMQVVDVLPPDDSGMIPEHADLRRAKRRGKAAAVPPARPAPLAETPPAQETPPPTSPEFPFPAVTPTGTPSVFERARAEAGKVAQALRKEFPEHPNRLRAREVTPQQKLASGIANSLAAPKLYEAPRITAIQDQGVGWGRRIDKVVTGMGTYCITYESNHGGDGRDVFKDALEPKKRTCPREE